MDRFWRVRLLVLACLVLVPSVARAQAAIAGVVRDTSGAVLPGVTVDASSPVLIEKVRSVATDGSGQYKIIDLRPGAYAVTFTLPGFSTVKRENIELTGSNTVTVNADLMVGSVTETLTVTGEAPTVDVQNTRRSTVISDQVVAALPAGRSSYDLAVLIPGVTLSTSFTNTNVQNAQDVGGAQNMSITLFTIHGNRPLDQRLMIDGLTLRHILASSASNFVPDMGTAAEVVIDYSSGTSESYSAGMSMNLIPKDGGNTFKGSAFGTGANTWFQGNNYTPELKAAGLSTPNTLARLYDINPSLGGPIVRDRLWFFGSIRWQGSSGYQAGAYGNLNGGDLMKWNYVPNLTARAEAVLTVDPSGSLRLTWQATPKNKISVSADPQQRHWINPLLNASSENYQDFVFNHETFATVAWSAPVTSRLLLDARFGDHIEGYADQYPAVGDPYRESIPVMDLNTGFLYRGRHIYSSQDSSGIKEAQASASYVSGSHALKVGVQDEFGSVSFCQSANETGLFYQFQGGTPDQYGRSTRPVSLEQDALPYCAVSHLSAELGMYAQDKWTYKRVTVNGGLRFDYFKNDFPAQSLGPTAFTPARDLTIPATDYSNLKDITPRVGIAYDLFGQGKTALKASWGKYLLNQSAGAGNPVNNLSFTASRSWTPSLLPSDPNYYTPQCNLLNPAANGECGALNNKLFGQLTPSAAIDPQTHTGWGHRAWDQEFSVSVQHEIAQRVSVDMGYFRRWYSNFTVVDNRAVSPSDFTTYSITAPVDARLPLSGQVIGPFFEVNPAKAGLVNNYTTFAGNFGNQYEHWNGVDVSINARPRQGVVLQGGLSTGRTSTDNCDLVAKLPGITLSGNIAVPESQCHVDTNFQTQVKFLGTYLVPKIDVQFGVTFQSALHSMPTKACPRPKRHRSCRRFRARACVRSTCFSRAATISTGRTNWICASRSCSVLAGTGPRSILTSRTR
jgi:hypothetical protein